MLLQALLENTSCSVGSHCWHTPPHLGQIQQRVWVVAGAELLSLCLHIVFHFKVGTEIGRLVRVPSPLKLFPPLHRAPVGHSPNGPEVRSKAYLMTIMFFLKSTLIAQP